jgi:hypothetical protein
VDGSRAASGAHPIVGNALDDRAHCADGPQFNRCCHTDPESFEAHLALVAVYKQAVVCVYHSKRTAQCTISALATAFADALERMMPRLTRCLLSTACVHPSQRGVCTV